MSARGPPAAGSAPLGGPVHGIGQGPWPGQGLALALAVPMRRAARSQALKSCLGPALPTAATDGFVPLPGGQSVTRTGGKACPLKNSVLKTENNLQNGSLLW